MRSILLMVAVSAVSAVAACKKAEPPPPGLGDTGWFGTGTTDPDGRTCDTKLDLTVPEAGETGWYWHERPEIFVTTPSTTDYEAWIQDAAGNRTDVELVWADNGLNATLEWTGWLEANTDYVLTVQDCDATTEVPFRTSALGLPLTIEPSDLVGRTYLLDIAGARWEQPPVIGSLISSLFTAPVLLGVTYADPARIDVTGAPGEIDTFGGIHQDLSSPSWDFPMANFTEAPFLDAAAPEIELVYQGTCTARVPVQDFVFQGTFSADGTTIGGAVLSGLGDTRHLGCLLQDADNLQAVCDLAVPFGVQCEPCDDGEPLCLYLEAHDLEGVLLTGVHLIEND